MNKQKKIPLLLSGHGAIINGKYQTKGKRYFFKDGVGVYEGEFNRDIKCRVMRKLFTKGIAYIDLNSEHEDISLKERVRRERELNKEHRRKTFVIPIHANAGNGKGTGCEAFVSRRASKASIRLGEIAEKTFPQHFPNEKWRGVKMKDFYICKNTYSPCLLVECFFMDRREDLEKFLITEEGRNKIADWITDIIELFIND